MAISADDLITMSDYEIRRLLGAPLEYRGSDLDHQETAATLDRAAESLT